MKPSTFLTWVTLVITSVTVMAKTYSYDIAQGSIVFTMESGELCVTQGETTPTPDDFHSLNNGAYPNITIYGNSTPTANTITINTGTYAPSGYDTSITLSNVVIHSDSDVPINVAFYSSVKLFLFPGTSNEVKTTGVWCPGIKVSDYDGSSMLTIKGSGTLVASGGEDSAGIGGNVEGNGSIIRIEERATVIATGGMGGAGIGGGTGTDGGDITISSNAVVFAKGGNSGETSDKRIVGGAAGIGGGGESQETFSGGVGGFITISGNARVNAQGGPNAAGIGGGSEGEAGAISIGKSNQVIAVSDGTRLAIDDDTIDGDGYVLMANYAEPRTAGMVTSIRKYVYMYSLGKWRWVWVTMTSVAPSINYQSIAFSVAPTATYPYLVYYGNARQYHDGGTTFPVTTTGITPFTGLYSVGGITVTLDKNGGSGGSDEVLAIPNDPMPTATAPTNSASYLTFGGYFLEDDITQYYNADMSSARNCDLEEEFTLYAKWIDGRVSGGTYDWYTNQASPYIIRTASQLVGLAAIVNGSAPDISRDTFTNKIVNLSSNIALAGSSWIPIGNYSVSSANIFQGTFNGGAKTISGFSITTNTSYQGLFGYIGNTAAISNLTVDASITASNYVGIVAGYSDGGKLQNCAATGTITATDYLGGIVGSSSGIIRDCSSSATVLGYDWVGGIAGYLGAGGSLQNCTCTGNVTGQDPDAYVGGIVGDNAGLAQNCTYSSSVTGLGSSAWVGGIAGVNSGTIQNGLMVGTLTFGLSTKIGGIAGENINAGSVISSYYLTASGASKAVGVPSGTRTSLGSFSNTVGRLTATDSTSLLYSNQLHIALNKWVHTNNAAGVLSWWTTSTSSYPSLTTNRPLFSLATPQVVPFDWLATYYPATPEANYETLAHSVGVNGYDVWESYVAGLVPTNSTSTFTASITFTNEKPYIAWSPSYSDRVYTIQGKAQLSTPSWGATNNTSRFFKVIVEKP